MRKKIRLRNTLFAGILALASYIISFLTDFELFEELLGILERIERYEGDEIFIGAVIILIGFAADLLAGRKENVFQLRIKEQRLSVLKATMRTVQDIVNNSLNNLQLVRMKAEQTGAIDEETLKLMDTVIWETAAKVKELGDLDDTPEKKSSSGVTLIDYARPKNTHSPKGSGISHNNPTDPSVRGE